jgi:AcrR family transcriptional regulator
VDNIVKASGVSKGGIYWHFKSKEEIFLYMIEKWLEEQKGEIQSRLSPGDPAAAKLGQFMDFAVEKAQSPVPALMHEFLMGARDESIFNKILALMDNYSADSIITVIINQGIESGDFKPLDARAASETFRAVCDGIIIRWYHSQNKDISALRRLAKAAVHIYLEGLTNR